MCFFSSNCCVLCFLSVNVHFIIWHMSFFHYSQTPTSSRSTLFPYTTLFRSRRRTSPSGCSTGWSAITGGGAGDPDRHPRQGDRKSTRLNSSHLVISYAVFCLKKKIISYYYLLKYFCLLQVFRTSSCHLLSLS